MDSFSNGITSSTSIKPSSVSNHPFNDAWGNNENEMNPEMASKFKKQLPTKNFMSHTICTTNKANVPKKKILAERNETIDVAEHISLRRSSSFDSKAVKSPVVNEDVKKDFVTSPSLKPYDPVNNYLSPRPKFLRYNPDRRRKIFDLQENEDNVKKSSSFDAELELGAGSPEKESVEEEAKDKTKNQGECEDDEQDESEDEEEEEEEIVEFEEDRGWIFKGFLKFLAVVISLILTTQAICSINSPTPSYTVKSWSNVYGAGCLNFSETGSGPIRELDLVVGRLQEVEIYHEHHGLDLVEAIHGVYEDEVVSNEEGSDSLQELETPDIHLENDEANVIHDEMWSKQEDTDPDRLEQVEILEDQEIAASELAEEAEKEVHDQLSMADSDATEEKYEIAEDVKDLVEEEEINDVETTDLFIRSASFDWNLAVLIGFSSLIITSFVLIYRSNRTKSSSPVETTVDQKEEIKILEPSLNSSSLIQQIDDDEEEEPLVNSSTTLMKDVSQEISHIHAPSVELLGEFVFGEEVTSSRRSFSIQATPVSSGENSTVESVAYTAEKTIKKQRRKTVTIVTPSPVRRSTRLRSIKSP